ncbi:MAG TPA: PilZ domain-containing protein [Candidatus Krumholzibacteria bacterium]|nr:PilZ domain-containing protein [Candidatus Krumholzibacteria bacterium]HPD71664.1 PilZ domain-containing protein [Candidatus Krumholzibacteria bacterium]HRY41403.1 PilZ domain-containing protein [Candidatus Krumholzibacteria bacterium]
MTDHGERRRSQRVDARLRLQVRLAEDDGRESAADLETVNISTSGVYFRSSHYIAPMTKLAMGLELAVPGGSGAVGLVQCQGLVVRIQPEEEQAAGAEYEVAVFFTWIEPDGQAILEEHINLLMA